MNIQSDLFYKDLIVYLYDAFKLQAEEEGLNIEEIPEFKKKKIKPLFPHKIVKQNDELVPIKYGLGEICCDIQTGYFCCGKSSKASEDMNVFGLGINLYFKYVKYLVAFFFLATIISAAPLFFYYQVSAQNNLLTADINSVLFSSTIGSLSASSTKCVYTNNNLATSSVNFSCSVGTMSYYNPVYSNNSYVNLKNCKTETTNSVGGTYNVPSSLYTISCSGNNCTFSGSATEISDSYSQFVSVPYSCKNSNYQIYFQTISNNNIIIGIVICDLLILVIYLVFSCFQTCSESNQKEQFQKSQTCLNDFSLEIKDFELDTTDASVLTSAKMADFIKNFRAVLEKQKGIVDMSIVKFKMPDNVQQIGQNERKKEIYFEMYELFQDEIFKEKIEVDKLTYEEFRQKVNYKKFATKIIKLIDKFRNENKPIQNDNSSVFITFETNVEKQKVYRSCDSFCFQKYLKIADKQYRVYDAPVPDLIIWKNLDRWRRFRTLISWVLTLLILVCSYVLIAYAYSEKNVLTATYNYNIDCSLKYSSSDEYTVWNSSMAGDSTWINCYCTNHLTTIYSHSQCLTWLKGYSFYTLSPLFVSLIIVAYNMLVSFIFRKLSEFQCHRYVTEELYSYVLKRTLLLLLNTGLVVLLINMRFDLSINTGILTFLFGGSYSDFTADWYYNIGIVILFTMLFNIFMPIVELFIEATFKFFLQMTDKKCWTTKTSKRTKSQYLDLYSGIVFPIEQRYAQILSILFITFAYNEVIPLLNMVSLFSFAILYISDKVLVFKFFKLKNYDQKLQDWIRTTALCSIVFHLVTSIFFLSEPTLTPAYYQNSVSTMLGNSKLSLIATEVHIYPYIILLGLFLIWFLFQNTFLQLIRVCTRKMKRLSYVQKYSRNFYDILNRIQIEQLLRVNTDEFLKNQHEIDMARLHINNSNANSVTQEELVLKQTPSIFRLVEKDNKITAANIDPDKLDEYATILYRQRKQLQARAKNDVVTKLIGMPGYDSTLAGDNRLVQKQITKFEHKLEDYCLSSIASLKEQLPK